VDADWDVDFIFSSARSEVQVALHFSCERGVIVFQNKKHIFNCGRGTDGETDISLASGLNKIISIGPNHDPWAVCILFSGVTSLPLTTTSRPSLGGENQM
jgi:hypothetical protein